MQCNYKRKIPGTAADTGAPGWEQQPQCEAAEETEGVGFTRET